MRDNLSIEGGTIMTVVSDKYRGSKEYLLVCCELVKAARCRGTTTYQAIAEIMGLPLTGAHMGREVGRMLGAIAEDEVSYGRPMLSAVAVGVGGSPGPGFFILARELGKLQEDSKEAERRFWEEEKEAVYATWQREFKS
jgi:hypothetical protein